MHLTAQTFVHKKTSPSLLHGRTHKCIKQNTIHYRTKTQIVSIVLKKIEKPDLWCLCLYCVETEDLQLGQSVISPAGIDESILGRVSVVHQIADSKIIAISRFLCLKLLQNCRKSTISSTVCSISVPHDRRCGRWLLELWDSWCDRLALGDRVGSKVSQIDNSASSGSSVLSRLSITNGEGKCNFAISPPPLSPPPAYTEHWISKQAHCKLIPTSKKCLLCFSVVVFRSYILPNTLWGLAHIKKKIKPGSFQRKKIPSGVIWKKKKPQKKTNKKKTTENKTGLCRQKEDLHYCEYQIFTDCFLKLRFSMLHLDEASPL